MNQKDSSDLPQVPDLVRRLLDGIADAAVVLTEDRRVVSCNQPYVQYTGLRNREIRRKVREGRRCSDLFPLSICQEVCAVREAAKLGRPIRMDEIEAVRGDGERLTLIVTATALGDGLFVETYRDVTAEARIQKRYHQLLELERRDRETLERLVEERTRDLRKANEELKQAQTMLVHQEKMSSLGRLAAGIAHELNNPISFVYGNIEFMEEYFRNLVELVRLYERVLAEHGIEDERIDALKEEVEFNYLVDDALKLMSSIRSGAERTAAIVRDLRVFSRAGGHTSMAPADLIEGLEATLTLLRPVLKNRIEVTLDLEELPRVVCNVGHINQVFMNILQNAADAIEGQGEIVIRARRTEEGVRFVFKDSGPGIPPEIVDKLFEPFCTTKEVGKGTGLGLAICDGIMRQHGGRLGVESRPGEGAVFVVDLPLVPPDLSGDEPDESVSSDESARSDSSTRSDESNRTDGSDLRDHQSDQPG